VDLNYKTNLIFPIPIHQFDVNGFSKIKDELIDYVYDCKKKDPKGVSLSNRGGWQSEGFEIINEDDVLQLFLINCLSNFPPIKESVQLRGYAWININKPGDYNIKHVHPTNNLSGVLWIKAPQNSGDIIFDSPNVFESFLENKSYDDDFKKSICIDDSYHFYPTEGRMIVFPSHLQHHVQENKSSEDRISVSFNIRLSNEN
jgi:hypothetical protein